MADSNAPGGAVRSCVAFLLALMAAPGFAAESFIDPFFVFTQEYTENLRLRPDRKTDTWISRIRPGTTLGYRTGNWDVGGQVFLNILRYYAVPNINIVERDFSLRNRYTTERNEFAFFGRYSVESSLTTETAETGVTDAVVATGRWLARPSWTYALTERDRLRLGYRYRQVDYDGDSAETGLFNFLSHVIDLGLAHDLSPVDQLTGTLIFGRYESDNSDERTNAYEFQFGWLREFTEKLTASLALGYVWSHSDFVVEAQDQSEDNGGVTILGFVDWKTRRTTLRADVVRQLRGSGSGGIREFNQLTLGLDHKLAERWNLTFNARGLIADSITEVLRASDRSFIRVTPAVRWRWTRNLSLEGGYTFRWGIRSRQDAATSNTVMLRLIFTPQAFSW